MAKSREILAEEARMRNELGVDIPISNGSFPILDNGTSTISNSNIYNDGNSVQNNEILSFSTATNNYWGDASGPYHPTQNTAGEGDSVNTFVNVK